MSETWGVEGARCQAALAVLASLCRARPPPVGLDVETCRSFELQTPERSLSAANAGNAKPEAPNFLDCHPNCPPFQSPTLLVPGSSGSRQNSGSRSWIRNQSPPVPWPVARRAAARRQGDPGGEAPSPVPCDPAGTPWKAGSPRCGAPWGLSFPSASALAPGEICQGRGLCREQTTDIPAEDRTRLLGMSRSQGPPVGLSVRLSAVSGREARAPGVSEGETWVFVSRLSARAAPRASAGGRGGRCRSALPLRL